MGAIHFPPRSGHVAIPRLPFLELPISKMYLTQVEVVKMK